MFGQMWRYGYGFFCWITANSNEYARLPKDAGTGCFGGSKWINIKLEDMIHFFGILLKMSIDDRKLGGDANILMHLFVLIWSKGIQLSWMVLRPGQKTSVFYPEPGFALDGDKYH